MWFYREEFLIVQMMKETHEDRIARAMQNLGIQALAPMQEAMLEAAGGKRDILLLSPTGSGKTLAFLLPLLRWLDPGAGNIQCLVIAPSRELAQQTAAVFTAMGIGHTACCCYGGHSSAEERKQLAGRCPSVVVGTPGRLLDHIRQGVIRTEQVRTLVVDEFDKVLELGFHEDMSAILASLHHLDRRVFLSATDSEEIPRFARLEHPCKLNFLERHEAASRVRMMKVCAPERDKLETLYRLLCHIGNRPAMVFANYREAVERIGGYLAAKGIENGIFHGGMEQKDRERALYKFRNGSCHVFVATDLASRGLDIPAVECIVHYHLPMDGDVFLHRNGRAARWNASGEAYLIIGPEENVPAYASAGLEELPLEGAFSKPAPPEWVTLYIGKGKKDRISRADVAGFLYKIAQLDRDDVGGIDVRDYYTFVAVRRRKLEQTLSLVRREKIKGMRALIEEAR